MVLEYRAFVESVKGELLHGLGDPGEVTQLDEFEPCRS